MQRLAALVPRSAVASDCILGYNWENDALPFLIGLEMDAVIKLGPVPTKIGIGAPFWR